MESLKKREQEGVFYSNKRDPRKSKDKRGLGGMVPNRDSVQIEATAQAEKVSFVQLADLKRGRLGFLPLFFLFWLLFLCSLGMILAFLDHFFKPAPLFIKGDSTFSVWKVLCISWQGMTKINAMATISTAVGKWFKEN